MIIFSNQENKNTVINQKKVKTQIIYQQQMLDHTSY